MTHPIQPSTTRISPLGDVDPFLQENGVYDLLENIESPVSVAVSYEAEGYRARARADARALQEAEAEAEDPHGIAPLEPLAPTPVAPSNEEVRDFFKNYFPTLVRHHSSKSLVFKKLSIVKTQTFT